MKLFNRKDNGCYCRKHQRCQCEPQEQVVLGMKIVVDPDMPKGMVALVGAEGTVALLTNVGDEDE